MAAAIISGLVSKGFDKQKIYVSEPWDVNRNKMADLGVKTTTSNLEAASAADVLIIAVKPQVAKTVCRELAASDAWSSSSASSSSRLPLLVSIAAGITSDSLKKWSTTPDGAAPPVVRVMPNTPALVGEGASGLYAAGGDVSAEQKELVAALMSSVSKATEWVDREELLDVVTGLSGKPKNFNSASNPFKTSSLCVRCYGIRTRKSTTRQKKKKKPPKKTRSKHTGTVRL
jgi:pyrroline-5-carboxylate reductase